MRKQPQPKIAITCENPTCKKVFMRSVLKTEGYDKHYCSPKCRFTHTTCGEPELKFVKENLHKLKQVEIAKSIGVSYDCLKSQLRRWERDGVIPKRERYLEPEERNQLPYFDWSSYPTGIITTD